MNVAEAMTALLALVVKEIRQTVRDKRVAVVLVVAPVLQLIVLGYAVNLQVEHVQLAVADLDHTRESRELVSDLVAGDAFDLVGHVEDAEAAMALLRTGDVPVALVIPKGFADDLTRGRPTALQVLVDGGDSNRATVAQNAITAFVQQRAMAMAAERAKAAAAAQGRALELGGTRLEPRVRYNPTLDSKIYFVPGVAATLLLVVILMVTAMGLAREKEVGTLEQVLVTPIPPSILIAGKTIPYAVIGLLDLALVLAAGVLIFDVPIRGSLLLVFSAGALYLLTVLGLGLLLSTASKNQQQAFMGAVFLVLPAILLSGFLTPVNNMPEWLQPLSAVDPVRHFVEILRSVLLKRAGWGDVLPQLTALAGLGITTFLAAVVIMRRRLS